MAKIIDETKKVNQAKRSCLKCRTKFRSESVGNRICPACQIANSKQGIKVEGMVV